MVVHAHPMESNTSELAVKFVTRICKLAHTFKSDSKDSKELMIVKVRGWLWDAMEELRKKKDLKDMEGNTVNYFKLN